MKSITILLAAIPFLPGCFGPYKDPTPIERRVATVLLDPIGAKEVNIGNSKYDVPPFAIPEDLNRAVVMDLIERNVADDVAPFGLVVEWDDMDVRPSNVVYRVHLGGFNDNYLGIAGLGGANVCAVFTDWHARHCGGDEETFARAVSNTIGHEVGHLIGLQHQEQNPFGLMYHKAPFASWICSIDQSFLSAVPVDPSARLKGGAILCGPGPEAMDE